MPFFRDQASNTCGILYLSAENRISYQPLTSCRPTPQATTNLLQQSEKQFMKSDESAFSIVPSGLSSRLSVSTDQTGDRDSIRSSASMAYRWLSFEDDLFTARVYKRNYRVHDFGGYGSRTPTLTMRLSLLKKRDVRI